MDKYTLRTGLREQTILKDVYFTPPFNLVEVRENKKNHLLEMMVMSSSPGLLNNDFYDINIEVIDNTALNLQTQSYQRIHISNNITRQKMNVKVGENSYFSHVPHPSVPHKGAQYHAVNRVNLKASSTLLWAEILTCGRKYMAEKEMFQFREFHSTTEIYQESKLIYKDNLYIKPEQNVLSQLGQYEEYTHQGGMVFVSPTEEVTSRIEAISARFAKEHGIEYGISKLSPKAYILRVLGTEGQQLFKLFSEIRVAEDKLVNEKYSAKQQNAI